MRVSHAGGDGSSEAELDLTVRLAKGGGTNCVSPVVPVLVLVLIPEAQRSLLSQDADAGVTSLRRHRGDDLPGVDDRVVTFDTAEQRVPVVSSDCVETSSENSRSYVTSWRRHACYSRPIVCSDVVHLNRVQVGNAVEASHHVDVVVE